MNKQYKYKFSLGTAIAVTLTSYLAYCMLFGDNLLPMSVSHMISQTNELSLTRHLLVLGFIPVYIAGILFSALMLGLYLGPHLQSLLARLAKKISEATSKTSRLSNKHS